MSFNKIVFSPIKNNLSFYLMNHKYDSRLSHFIKRNMCSHENRRGKYLIQEISNGISKKSVENNLKKKNCEEIQDGEKQDDDIEMEDMFCETSSGKEWGGPMRGGRFYEPTRYGDWERKGRCTDF